MIRVGIGGWTFPPWRGTFYPPGLQHAHELAYAASRLTSIEINATFHGTQKPDSFRRWRDAVPDNFIFAVKAPRFATWRGTLAEAGPSIERFLDSGVTELGSKLGPLLWQLPPTRRFDQATIEPFLALLPRQHANVVLRHTIETPHHSFDDPAFAALLRRHGVAWTLVEDDVYPAAKPTADFVYARLKRNTEMEADGYSASQLVEWHERLTAWRTEGHDCFVYFIGGDKVRAPDAAIAMLRLLH